MSIFAANVLDDKFAMMAPLAFNDWQPQVEKLKNIQAATPQDIKSLNSFEIKYTDGFNDE